MSTNKNSCLIHMAQWSFPQIFGINTSHCTWSIYHFHSEIEAVQKSGLCETVRVKESRSEVVRSNCSGTGEGGNCILSSAEDKEDFE